MLRMSGRIIAPLNLENQGLRPVIAFPTSEGPEGRRYFPERVVPVTVQGEFPSGFTLDLREPPPIQAVSPPYGGEPGYARGHLMVVGPNFPAVVSGVRADQRPIPECTSEMSCYRNTLCEGIPSESLLVDGLWVDSDGTLPPELTCLSRIAICTYDDSDPSASPSCPFVREEGDPKLHAAGYADGIEVTYFPEPIEADTVLAVMYNAGDAISSGYHAYLFPELEPDVVATDGSAPPSSPSCQEEVEADLLAEYNAEHGTSHPFPPIPAVVDDESARENFEWQRAVFREMRKRGCKHLRTFSELGPEDLIEITLVSDMPQPP
jgi:hypothetical protein